MCFAFVINVITSIITGAKIRTMWMTPFYLFFGTLFVQIFKKNIDLKKIKKFYIAFFLFFFFSQQYILQFQFTMKQKEQTTQVKKFQDLYKINGMKILLMKLK